jgi:hypothetical protein
MNSTSASEVYDLLILVDATASMNNYLRALRQSLPQVISIAALTNCFQRIGLLAYRDYCDKNIIEWSGWMNPSLSKDEDQPDLVDISSKLDATGGGDWPEATKTGLSEAYKHMRVEVTTLVLLYTDAPPHVEGEDTGYSHAEKESKALNDAAKSGEHGKLFVDWVSAGQTLRSGDKKAHVVSILDRGFTQSAAGFYTFLSGVTEGASMFVNGSPSDISQTTVEVLLAWMGVHKAGAESVSLPANFCRYKDTAALLSVQSEKDPSAASFFPVGVSGLRAQASDQANFEKIKLSTDLLDKYLPKKASPLQDFAKTYKESAAYRSLVVRQLRDIIERDVSAISLNPVFGSLWRTFCNDRENDQRQEVIDLFGRKVEAIRDANEKARMKEWLEESYDYTAEVQEAIAKVPASERFPCVCLDPTLTFVRAGTDGEDDSENKPITAFRRDELLEIGRSCDWRILRRLGRVLTRLTFIDSEDAMPAHIAKTSETEVPRIPMALASQEYGRRFWNILLHIVVPGTMLSARPAALVAALAIRLGVEPFIPAAEKAMLFWKKKWNDIEVPETWNVNCLSLILDADKMYRNKHRGSQDAEAAEGLLLAGDRALFERLVDYKMLELNLRTTLTAEVGWTPSRNTLILGPVVMCKVCEYPRSVTIMAQDNVCGMCLCEYETAESAEKAKSNRVSKSDTESSKAVWYECSMQTCRAQYVVYNVEHLNVRPKCHYCRQQGDLSDKDKQASPAPVVECVKCLSRMIWPPEYRPNESMSDWTCVACTSGVKSIVDAQTTAGSMRDENGDGWLLRNDDSKLKAPFNGRTLYHTASTAVPLDDFVDKVHILPARGQEVDLFLRGKLIRNTPHLLDQLYSWVSRRRTEAGTCSLCFSNFKKLDLLPACGRSGCSQRICKECLYGWYGLNGAGRIINTTALNCPFCRRSPTAKTLANYGMGVHAVGNLREAVEYSGSWIHAWCFECGNAKACLERVCAAGAPPDLQDWTCDDCRAKKSEVRTIQNCPSCGTPTEKRGGCDHIQCTVPGCGAHWCWYCGEQSTESEIYNHMRNEHGGYYAGEEEEDSDAEDTDEDM